MVVNSYAEHEGELGYCVMCDTAILDRVDNYLVPNEQYTELWFELSNSSVCKIAFCKKHVQELSDKDYPAIMQGVKNGWEKEFKITKWEDKQIQEYKNNFFNLTIRRQIDEKDNISVN